ncbi:MAG: hypothetical protein ABI602_00660 [Candidatus Saccharibacteria bacterium]
MENQSPLDPHQPPSDPRNGVQPATADAQSSAAGTQPVAARPYFSPPPGYQAGSPLDPRPGYMATPPPRILPPPVAPGQATYFPPTPQTLYQSPLPLELTVKRRRPTWLYGLVAVIGVAVVAVALFFGLRALQAEPTKAAQKVSDQFISDLQKDDSFDAYSLTSPTYQQHNSVANFEKIVSQVSGGLQGPASVAARQASKSTPPHATLVYKVPTQYAVQYLKVDLVGGDSWQVSGFSASTISPSLKTSK